MDIDFNLGGVKSVEFYIGKKKDSEEEVEIFFVPVDKPVQELLPEILANTLVRLDFANVLEKPLDVLELAEKYGPNERLVALMTEPWMETLRSYLTPINVPSAPNAMNEPGDIAFYFAKFTDANGKNLFAFRRASSFKAVLRARHRLVKFVQDSLKLVSENIFKLDPDFDFLVTKTHCLVLHYAGFEMLARIQSVVTAKASEYFGEVAKAIGFVEADSLSEYVKEHPRAAKLVASIRSRGNLGTMDNKKFKTHCRLNGIQFKEENGKISPQAGFEIPFLEAIDRRRYTVSFVNGAKEYYVATSRKGVPAPTVTG